MNFPARTAFALFTWALFLVCAAGPSAALKVPPLRGRVNDYAGMISPSARADIEARLEALERSDSTQAAVLTVESLEGRPIEEFSMKVAERWKIGQKRLDNGVIIVVARQDRRLRIEVGYGLEGRLTDLVAGRIIDNEMKPAFRSGDYDGGFRKGVDAVIRAVRGEYAASREVSNFYSHGLSGGWIALIIVLSLVTIGIIIYLIALWKVPAGIISGPFLYTLSLLPWLRLSFDNPFIYVFFVQSIPFTMIPAGFAHDRATGGGGFFSGWSSVSSQGGGFSGGGGGFGGGGASGSW
jgi:uncharacterized protein